MNPFDPVLEKDFNQLTNGVQSAGEHCGVIPAIRSAVSSIGHHLQAFYHQQRVRVLKDVLVGNGPVAQLHKQINPTDPRAFTWDLITLGEERKTHVTPEWVQNYANAEYVKFLLNHQNSRVGEESLNTDYVLRGLHVAGIVLLRPTKPCTVPQANNTGEVLFNFEMPSIYVSQVRFSSQFEGIPEQKQDDRGSAYYIPFNFERETYWSRYLTTDVDLPNKKYEPLAFPTIANDPDHHELVIRLRNFLMVQGVDGVVYTDGVITLYPTSLYPEDYTVELSNGLWALLKSSWSQREMSWESQPRLIQEILTQMSLQENTSTTVDISFDDDYNVVVTPVSRSTQVVEGGLTVNGTPINLY